MCSSDLRRQLKALAETREAQSKASEAEAAGGAGETGEAGVDDLIYLEPRAKAWKSAWTLSERLVEQLRDEVKRVGARFVFMTLSTSIQVHPDAVVREQYAKRIGAADLGHPERRFEAFARMHEIDWISPVDLLRRAAESSGQCVHGSPGPWECQGHWNAEGHRIAGEALARALCTQLEPQATSRSPASIDSESRP